MIPFLENADMVDGKVWVYWNIKKKVFSVKQKGRVLFHTRNISLRDARMVVWKSGYERCIREGKKNVHSFIVGHISSQKLNAKEPVMYNPYKSKCWMSGDNSVSEALGVDMNVVGSTPRVLINRAA